MSFDTDNVGNCTFAFPRIWVSSTYVTRFEVLHVTSPQGRFRSDARKVTKRKLVQVTSQEAGKPLAKVGNHERFRVYGKTACPQCAGPINVAEIASRKLYWCQHCQS